MSWQISPLKIDWTKFLKSFPKAAKWSKPTKKKLTYDDLRWQDPWIACYLAMARDLPDKTLFAVDEFVRATTFTALPKPKGFKTPEWYKPHREYDEEDFEGPGSGCEPIPRMSPGNVVDMLHRLRSRDAAKIEGDLRAAWDRMSGKKATEARELLAEEGVEGFLVNLREWRGIMEEIEAAGAGFALDLA